MSSFLKRHFFTNDPRTDVTCLQAETFHCYLRTYSKFDFQIVLKIMGKALTVVAVLLAGEIFLE